MRAALYVILLLGQSFAITAADLFTISNSNARYRLQFLKQQFTEPGWQNYYKSLDKSGVLALLKAGDLSMRAQNLDQNTIIVTYDLPTYSYNQKLSTTLRLDANKIDYFTSTLISQSELKPKRKKCYLKSRN